MDEPRTAAGRRLHRDQHAGCAAVDAACPLSDRILAIEREAAEAARAEVAEPDLGDAARAAFERGAALLGTKPLGRAEVAEPPRDPDMNYAVRDAMLDVALGGAEVAEPGAVTQRIVAALDAMRIEGNRSNLAYAREIVERAGLAATAGREPLDEARLAEAWANVMDGRRIGTARISRDTTTADDWRAILDEYPVVDRIPLCRWREPHDPHPFQLISEYDLSECQGWPPRVPGSPATGEASEVAGVASDAPSRVGSDRPRERPGVAADGVPSAVEHERVAGREPLDASDIAYIANCIPWERADLRQYVRAALGREPLDALREAAQAVVDGAEADDNFDGEFIEYLVPFAALDALRAALDTPDPGAS